MQLYGVKYIKCLRTRNYGSEQKCEWNLSDYSWQLSHFIWIVLTLWFWHNHSEHWQNFQSVLLSLAVGQIEHLPSHLPPPFFTVKGKLVVCNGHTMLSWPCEYAVISTLSCELTIFSPGESRYRHLQWFFFSCQLGYFSIHSTNTFTQKILLKLRKYFQTPVPCWSCTSAFSHNLVQNIIPTFSGIIVHDNFTFFYLFPHHCTRNHDAVMKGGWQPCFLLVHAIPVLGYW